MYGRAGNYSPTVGDFRTADVAEGGQGAPLVPYLDGILLSRHFGRTGRVGVALNIGGISNMTAFIPGEEEPKPCALVVVLCLFVHVLFVLFVCLFVCYSPQGVKGLTA